jgi:hypothetical protein
MDSMEVKMATTMSGRIDLLRVERGEVLISLDNDPATGPLNNWFILEGEHGRFNAAFSLALAAAANRWPVTIRIGGSGEIDPKVAATIRRITVGWRAGDFDND